MGIRAWGRDRSHLQQWGLPRAALGAFSQVSAPWVGRGPQVRQEGKEQDQGAELCPHLEEGARKRSSPTALGEEGTRGTRLSHDPSLRPLTPYPGISLSHPRSSP